MPDRVDYDNLAEAVGLRIQDGDHITKDVCRLLNACTGKTLRGVRRRAKTMRARAVKDEKYLRALIIDTAIQQLNDEIENQ